MSEMKRTDNWAGGINNLAQIDRLPEGQVRDLVNLDPVGGGGLQLRAAQFRIHPCNAVHGAVAYSGGFLVADGPELIQFSFADNTPRVLASIAGTGGLCGAELNGDTFLCTANDSIRVRDGRAGPWGLSEIHPRVTVVPGSMPAGVYRVAVTAIDEFGSASGAAPMIVTLAQPGAIELLWSPPVGAIECQVYASAADGETLYRQASGAMSGFTVSSITDSSDRMTTANLVRPPVATQVYAYKGRLVLVVGSTIWITEPYAPHLCSMTCGFVQYGSPVDMVAVTDGGIYVSAGQKTYFLTGVGTDGQSQRAVLEFGAVRGSGMTLPDGRAAWMTRYGQAFGEASGAASLPQRPSFAPSLASDASVGIVENNGVQMLVTTMKGTTGPNTLGVGDSFDLEIE